MKNVYLTGFMGTGKTTVGRILAKKLNREFIETDEVIELREGSKIADIFAKKGEGHFRELERGFLRELSLREDLIVSCGGGLICGEENLILLKESGIVFSLTASAQIIYQRTKRCTHRPLINVDDPLMKITGLLAERLPYYRQAHYSINTEEAGPEEVADEIIVILGRETCSDG